MFPNLRIFCLLLTAIQLLPYSSAQADSVDSLLTTFDRSANWQTANQLFKEFHHADVSDPVTYQASTPKDSLRKEVWYWSGEYYYAKQRYRDAIRYAEKAIPLLRAGSNRDEEADCLSLLAISNIRQSNYEQAAVYAKQCYQLDKQSGDEDRICSSLNTLTAIYLSAKQPQEAEHYVVKALSMVDEKRTPQRKAVLLGMASEVYHALGNNPLALTYAEAAYALEKKLGRKDAANIRLAQKAAVLNGLKRYKEAQQILQTVIPAFREKGNLQSLGISCNKMGQALQKQNRQSEALGYYREAVSVFRQLHDIYNEMHARRGIYESLWDINPDSARIEMEQYNALKDSIYNHTTAESLARFKAEFDTEQLRDEKDAEHQAKRQAIWAGLTTTLLLLILAAGIWYAMYRRNNLQNQINQQLSADILELREKYKQLQIHYDNALVTRSEDNGEQETTSAADRELMEHVVNVINEHINAGQVDAAKVAEDLNMSPFQFRQRLTVITGETPQSFIQIVRMRRARYLLDNNPELNITQIANLCAYNDTPNFTRAFKKSFGLTPSQYLEKQHHFTK